MATFLSDNTLAQMRADQAKLRPDTCTIRRYTTASDGMGGITETWANLATGVTVRIMPAGDSARELLVAAGLTQLDAWLITLPYGQDVNEKDRIVSGGRTFEVIGVQPHSWETARRVYGVEVA